MIENETSQDYGYCPVCCCLHSHSGNLICNRYNVPYPVSSKAIEETELVTALRRTIKELEEKIKDLEK